MGLNQMQGGFEYKLNEINVSDSWNPEAHSGKEFGGFNFTTESCILRWLHRGSTIYDVEIPKDAETVKIEGATILFRTNKIIVKNPRKVNDDLALHYYEISNIPEKSYYKVLGAAAVMNYKKTALKILKDKVNKNNINEVLEEWNEFIDHDGKNDRKDSNETVKIIERMLLEIKADN